MEGSGGFYKMRKRSSKSRTYGKRNITEAESCTGKEAFGDPTTARLAAQRRVGRVSYRCQYCGAWHVGTSWRK